MTTKVEVAAKEFSDDVALQAAFNEGFVWTVEQAKEIAFRDSKLVEVSALEALAVEEVESVEPTPEAVEETPAPAAE